MPVDLTRRDFDPNVAELMDQQGMSDAELAIDLENLRHLNRWFGSYRLIRHYLGRLLRPGTSYRFADLCTGSGDIPRVIVDWCRARNIKVTIDAYDFQEATLAVARKLSDGYPEITYHQCDVTRMDFAHRYSGIFCSLALHHFSNADATKILQQMLGGTTNFALLADLERGRFTWLGVRFITSTVFREPMTVHDALLSVRRSFSYSELSAIALEAGWKNPEHRRFLYGRQALLVRSGSRS